MGRKIEIKKIEEKTKCQVTFSKRRSSLLKKAEEIAICCDVDVLFVAFSPAGRLNKFCSQKRIEDMLQRYLKLPVERRLSHMDNVQEKMAKVRQLNHIRGDVSKLHFLDKQEVLFDCSSAPPLSKLQTDDNLELQIKKSSLELQIVNANLRDYEPGPEQEPSLHQLCWCERNLQLSLQKVMARKMELEKQGKVDVHFVAQQTTPQQFDTNNWIKPYSSNIQGISTYQNWMDKGKRVTNITGNYAYTPSFASSSQSGNILFSQIQNPSPYIPSQSQKQNMVIDVQQNPTQIFGQSEAQLTFGESSDNSLMNFWQNICASTRPISSPLVTTDTQFNNPSQLGLESAHSNWNDNNNNHITQHNAHPSIQSDAIASNVNGFNNSMETSSNWNENFNNISNDNHVIQQNDHSSLQSDAMAPNVSGFDYSMAENNIANNVENTLENEAWEWDDDFLNEAFNGEEFRNLD